ncbi:MAG: hypothetical protein KKI06_01860 [Euryarchaeota archaeon]|nr:hypothetical protein [Euryarchaeota archaeon]MCG2736488.1 hypothetical protein [Candidatus Methanoperedenaceae archaeon]MDP3105349.1 hypothetical protein [Candidatus Methanoperedens sp.]
MLKTPEERIKLLKAGISAKDIEKLYIIYNDFRVVCDPILYESNNNGVVYHENDRRINVSHVMLKSCK